MSFPQPFYNWRPHPWHGLETGKHSPRMVNAFIEICPSDMVKYEVDKVSGYLKIDRPQSSSSRHPTLYGFIPKTYCGEKVGKLMKGANGGDGDPLDICVVSERPVDRAEIICSAKIIGGLPMLDGGEADDKIIAVLHNDPVWSQVDDIDQLPAALLDRLRHYFLTYKMEPVKPNVVEIGETYDREHAYKVINASIDDYNKEFAE